MKKIDKKIVAFKVVKPGDEPKPEILPDINPLELRIDHRPDGTLEAITDKVVLSTQEGIKKVYVIVSFMQVKGRLGGREITIERPIEFFIPMSQSTDEDQWITGTMRSLSLAARGGYCAENLSDLTKVSWNKGPVRCGKIDYGNNKLIPMNHNSETAAIAWSIQQILHHRGFLDIQGNQVPAAKLAENFERRFGHKEFRPEIVNAEIQEAVKEESTVVREGGLCAVCGNYTVVVEQGCKICKSCGDSKCG